MLDLLLVRMIVLFLMQLMICEAGFVAHFPKKNHFVLRFVGSLFAFMIMVAVDALIRSILPGNGSYLAEQLKSTIYFAGIVFCNALVLTWSFDVNYSNALFAVIAGYSIEHAASRFSYILKVCFFANASIPPFVEYVGFDFLIPVLFSVLSYIFLIRESIATKRIRYGDKGIMLISGVNLFICISLSTFEPELGGGTDREILAMCASYVSAILGCALCLLLQAGRFRESELDEKNRILEEMLQMEREKQVLSKETIDIINQKCHDLRHQIGMLERQTPEDRSKALKRISDAILIYDSIVKTGNAAVDLMLMEKQLFCEKYGIQFSYLVDGEKFSFMDEADIYAMLGNMLENAFESVMQERDREKRIVNFVAHARSGMLYISMENYCAVPVQFKDSFPETNKKDKAFHGFGTRSIAYIAERYGGSVRFGQENHYFTVEILLPLGRRKQKQIS